MQTKDYDDYIYVSSTLGFRKVNDEGNKILLTKNTDGYCNVYADSISVSYLHSMKSYQVNAIDFFEDNHKAIFDILTEKLSKKFTNPKLKLGFRHLNVLNKNKDDMSFVDYAFLDSLGNKITVKLHKLTLVRIKN